MKVSVLESDTGVGRVIGPGPIWLLDKNVFVFNMLRQYIVA